MLATAAPLNYAARVDRERRQHETALTLHLLIIYARAASHSLHAVRLGHDPITAALDVIAGSEAIGQPGIAAGTQRLLIGAYESGWRRAHIEGERATLALESDELPIPEAARHRMGAMAAAYAREAARIVSNGLTDAIRAASGGIKGLLNSVRGWWRSSGLVTTAGAKPAKAAAAGSTLAIAGYNGGTDEYYERLPIVLGFRFSAILDDATTHYCRPLNGVQLPKDDPRWEQLKCPRHWGCRSLRRPIFGEFTPTLDVPEIPPQAGFPR